MGICSDKWGILLHGGYGSAVATSFTEGGSAYGLGAEISCNSRLRDSYSLGLDATWLNTNGILFPGASDVEGSYSDNSHRSFLLSLGRRSRFRKGISYNNSGEFEAAFFSSRSNFLGIGGASSTQPSRTVGGEEFSFGGSSATTFDIGQEIAFGGELRPDGRFPAIALSAGLRMLNQYNSSASEWNRFSLMLMFSASIGMGDDAVSEDANGPDTSDWARAYLYSSYALGILNSIISHKIISQQSAVISDYGLDFGDGGTDPGSTEDIRALQGALTFIGASGMTGMHELMLEDSTLPIVLELLKGAVLFASSATSSGRGNGLGNILNALDMIIYTMDDAPSPTQLATGSFLANSAVFLLGALIGGNFGTTLEGGASAANAASAWSPNIGEYNWEETVSYIPFTSYHGQSNGVGTSGSRSGISIRKRAPDSNLFTGVHLKTHALRLDNIFNRTNNTAPYEDASLPTEVGAQIGFQFGREEVRAEIAVGTAVENGGQDTAGIGVSAGVELAIPFGEDPDSMRLVLGVDVDAYKDFPNGYHYEIAPRIGLSF